ncbi:MAG TPA: M1 family aminopeptidase, partial [Thermoanaerobaculia bacterium]|nr:M1 family aminopeptidase [Thermoanaerobaculia bacterium]
IGNDVYDDDVTIILPTPLARGQKRHIGFEYDLELPNYAPGGYWYPEVPDTWGEKFTARMELTVNKKNEVRSMGRMESKREENDREVSVWVVEHPTAMITFSTATRFEEQKVEAPSIPPVYSFGPNVELGNRNKVRNVAADVANSLQWFQFMLQDKVPEAQNFYVTSIAAGHGQAFDGFLHMSEYTYTGEHPGASELFRAHEVAHEWWGHKVGWKSYRDQWLSEAFAEYSSMMFVQAFVKGGDKFFEEILDSYEGIVLGDLRGGFSKFNRPWLVEFNTANRARLGPIGHGYRASTLEIPAGYQIQAYHKGPLVLHMLRTMLKYKTGNDDLFVEILRTFVHDYSGKLASTADFRSVVEKKAPGDWGFFFDSWVNSAEIPSYRWSYSVAPSEGGGYTLTINLKRSNVGSNFTTVIPVRIDYEDGKSGVTFIMNKAAEESVTRKLAAKPKTVVFAPEHSLLADIRKD